MKLNSSIDVLTKDPVAAANEAVKVYKRYLGTKAFIWSVTLCLIMIIKKIAEPDNSK